MTSTRLPISDVCVRMPDLRLGHSGVPHSPPNQSDSHHATPEMPPLGNPGNPPWRNLGPSAHEARLVDAVPAAAGIPAATEVSPAATSTTPRPQRGREPRALRRWGTQLGVTIAAAVLLAVVHHALTAPTTPSMPETAPVTWSSDQVVLGTPVPMTEAQPGTSPESTHSPDEDGPETQMNNDRVAQRPAAATGRAMPPPEDSQPSAELPPPLPTSDDVNGGEDPVPNGTDAVSPESAYTLPEMPSPADPSSDTIVAPPLVAPAENSPDGSNASAVGSDTTTAPPLVNAAALPDSNVASTPAKPSYPLTSQYDAPRYLLQDPVATPARSGPTAASPPSADQATTPAASPYPYTNNPFAQPLKPSGTPGPTARLDKKIMTTTPSAIPPVQR